MTEERLQEIRAMVNTGFIPAPGNATVAQLLEYSDSLDAENERLHDENQSLRRSLTSEAVKDAKYNAEIMRLRKELEEARKATLVEVRDKLHGKILLLTVEMDYAEPDEWKLLNIKYEALAEEWKYLTGLIGDGQEGEGNQ